MSKPLGKPCHAKTMQKPCKMRRVRSANPPNIHSPRVPCYMCYMCYISQGKPLNIHSSRVPCYMYHMCFMALYSTYTTDFARTEYIAHIGFFGWLLAGLAWLGFWLAFWLVWFGSWLAFWLVWFGSWLAFWLAWAGEFELIGFSFQFRVCCKWLPWLSGWFGLASGWLSGWFGLASGWLSGWFGLASGWLSGWFGLAHGWLSGWFGLALFFFPVFFGLPCRNAAAGHFASISRGHYFARSVLDFESFAGRGQMLDGRVLEASQVEYEPFGKTPLKREPGRRPLASLLSTVDGLDTPLGVDAKIANALLGLATKTFVAAQLASRRGAPSLQGRRDAASYATNAALFASKTTCSFPAAELLTRRPGRVSQLGSF